MFIRLTMHHALLQAVLMYVLTLFILPTTLLGKIIIIILILLMSKLRSERLCNLTKRTQLLSGIEIWSDSPSETL